MVRLKNRFLALFLIVALLTIINSSANAEQTGTITPALFEIVLDPTCLVGRSLP